VHGYYVVVVVDEIHHHDHQHHHRIHDRHRTTVLLDRCWQWRVTTRVILHYRYPDHEIILGNCDVMAVVVVAAEEGVVLVADWDSSPK
jgi:hypothetical protein